MTNEKLAIDGGTPARRRPNPSMCPGGNALGAEEEAAVVEVIRSKRLFRYYGPGEGVSRTLMLEEALSKRMGVPHVAAVGSGTAALMCSLAAVGVGPGDEVIVPAYTWIASASAVVMVGGIPIVADVDESLSLDPAAFERAITPRTKAVIPVHMRGAPADMDAIMTIARRHGLRVVEDVAQANGGSFRGKPLGTFGDTGAFSLQFNKVITSGEGGFVTTSDNELFSRVLMYHDPFGGLRNDVPTEKILPGMNLRMAELPAAVALVQLGRLDGLVEAMRARKRVLEDGIASAVRTAGGRMRMENDPAGGIAIASVFFLPSPEEAAWAVEALNAENVGASLLFGPFDYHVYDSWEAILQQRAWSPHGGPWRWGTPVTYSKDMCKRSLDLLRCAVHLDVNPELAMEEIGESVVGVNKVLAAVVGRR